MALLILLRHGRSAWNDENRFTGSVNVNLSNIGIQEAEMVGEQLQSYCISHVFCSTLNRSMCTAEIVLKHAKQNNFLLHSNTALNERNYGILQGLNKRYAIQHYGAEQIQLWRRGYDEHIPYGETLKETSKRVMCYYNQIIKPLIKFKNIILIVAHSNSLRVLIRELEKKDDLNTEIPNCVPICYEFPE